MTLRPSAPSPPAARKAGVVAGARAWSELLSPPAASQPCSGPGSTTCHLKGSGREGGACRRTPGEQRAACWGRTRAVSARLLFLPSECPAHFFQRRPGRRCGAAEAPSALPGAARGQRQRSAPCRNQPFAVRRETAGFSVGADLCLWPQAAPGKAGGVLAGGEHIARAEAERRQRSAPRQNWPLETRPSLMKQWRRAWLEPERWLPTEASSGSARHS